MAWMQTVTLDGNHVSLVPLSPSHRDDLSDSVKDGDLWQLWYTSVPEPENVQAEIDRRLKLQAEGSMLPFAVIDRSTGKAVGMTTYMNIDAVTRRLEIGYTWYRKSMQRTACNTECKLMLLGHAFEILKCVGVEFRTSFFNQASRRGIERLGAKLDGILRNHGLHKNGTLRDTVVYSIIENEWPVVKEHLRFQLDRPRE